MAAQSFVRGVRAEKVVAGNRFITRTGTPSPPVVSVRTIHDSFGTPAMVEARLEGGRAVRIAYGSTIRVHTNEPAPEPTLEDLPAHAADGSPEAVLVAAAREHPEDPRVVAAVARLSRGLNVKSGAHLHDVAELAHLLFVELDDRESAWCVLGLLTGLEFDGNLGRWKHVQSALALAAFLSDQDGDAAAAAHFGSLLRAADTAEDPARARLEAEVLQRRLDNPDLFDREIRRAAAAGNTDAEHVWRNRRLRTLLFLRAHGGSRTLDADELGRLVQLELDALRA
ncbi:hypothetical protein NCCP1664_13070 [Zafaria cholistanensis]|uniref:Uncharacterized protein n=1 Tax=Zafaria cholistanensis TaxID=1682741 RepID=A0A5A7NPT7_9MICC|nr:DUF6707 family protein [Zafaria cholistanensis]GER22810.1 hypothetical protein NCCP1664_13070 [Zafaria cholistanensis]